MKSNHEQLVNANPINTNLSLIKHYSKQQHTSMVKQSNSLVHKNIPIVLDIKQSEILSKSQIEQNQGINKWKQGRRIGQSSSSEIYRVLNKKTGVIAVLKKIMRLQQDLQSQQQLKILRKVKHSNIVHYIEHYNLDKQCWIYMEYISSTLEKFYLNYGPPPYKSFMHFAKQLINAIDYLHNLPENKIIHKDLKCSNVLLTSEGVVKLTDFGCSKGLNDTYSLNNYETQGDKTFKGTINWMAPQTARDNIYTRKTDIWNLGCTLLELASGKIPWQQKKKLHDLSLLKLISEGNKPELPEQLHPNIKHLLDKCLQIQPSNRLFANQLLNLNVFN